MDTTSANPFRTASTIWRENKLLGVNFGTIFSEIKRTDLFKPIFVGRMSVGVVRLVIRDLPDSQKQKPLEIHVRLGQKRDDGQGQAVGRKGVRGGDRGGGGGGSEERGGEG